LGNEAAQIAFRAESRPLATAIGKETAYILRMMASPKVVEARNKS
jgi:hypothetical protein